MVKQYKNNEKIAGNRPPSATLSELRSQLDGNDYDEGKQVMSRSDIT